MPAVTGLALLSAPTVSLLRTVPETVFGLASSLMAALSLTATGRLSVTGAAAAWP
ncbi:MAG: hypothetical protein HY306_04020 [Nitrosomonadales bacterium]|nr:hypothetical protein [Nitrosomonadales bacterium]